MLLHILELEEFVAALLVYFCRAASGPIQMNMPEGIRLLSRAP